MARNELPSLSRKDPELLNPADIVVGERLRPLSEDAIPHLVESIATIGLQTPISVRRVGNAYRLIAGLHRLEACRRLGRPVPCFVFTDEAEAALWEISENLHRRELTVQERAEHIAKWVRLTEEKVKAQPAPLDRPHDRGRPNQGINLAARELDLDRTGVQRAIKIASMTPEAKQAARAAGIDDSQAALLRVASRPPDEQVLAVQAEIVPITELDAAYRGLMNAWENACQEARLEFLRRVRVEPKEAG